MVGFRNDYCIRCAQPRLAVLRRTFDVLHIWFVPVLPLGFWKRWSCDECGAHPHANVRTRRSIKWAGTALIGVFGFVGWASPVTPPDFWFLWGLRIAGPLAFVAAAWASYRSPPDVDLRQHLRAIPPLTDVSCLVCDGALLPGEPTWSCPQCGARRYTLPQQD